MVDEVLEVGVCTGRCGCGRGARREGGGRGMRECERGERGRVVCHVARTRIGGRAALQSG